MDITQQYFTCKKCGESKIWGDMVKREKCKYGIEGQCKCCSSKYNKGYKLNNSGKIRKYTENYRDKRHAITNRWQRNSNSTCGDWYIKSALKKKGFTREQIAQNPELINIQRIIIQTKRLCKT